MDEERRSHHALAEMAKKQHGVLSVWQLAELGYSTETLRRATEAERLHRIHRGAYAVGHTALSRQAHCLAATFSCGDGALLSHRSAAWIWGLTSRFCFPVEITATSPRRTRAEIRVHSAEALLSEDRTIVERIPVTAVPRTLLDFAAIDPRFLGRALDNAQRLGLLDLIAIDALVSRSRGFRGVARLREALAIHRTSAFSRSGLERRFLHLIRNAGLPTPSMNLFIEGYELDAYWPAERFAVELDTYDYHGSRTSFETDRQRQEDLKLAGIEMVRITGIRIKREPRSVVMRLRRLLAQRRRQLALSTEPPRGDFAFTRTGGRIKTKSAG
jgi:predicted transcriptional regulator of viral defense system/very-short-patch-repair endonuclease